MQIVRLSFWALLAVSAAAVITVLGGFLLFFVVFPVLLCITVVATGKRLFQHQRLRVGSS